MSCSDRSRSIGEADAGVDAGTETLFLSTPDTFAIANEDYSYQVQLPREQYVFSLAQAPQGMSVGAETGLVTWVPNDAQGGPHEIVVKATDDNETFEQSYVLQVAVPRLLAEAEITSAGGTLSGEGIGIDIPANAVSQPTWLSLFTLEQGVPPLWSEMEQLQNPFMIRSRDSELTKLPVQLRLTPDSLPTSPDSEVLIASEVPGLLYSGAGAIIVVDPTGAGLSATEVTADLTMFDVAIDIAQGWSVAAGVQVRVIAANNISVAWAYSSSPTAFEEALANTVLGRLEDAKMAVAAMNCDIPSELRVYIGDFLPRYVRNLGVYRNDVIYLNKQNYLAWPVSYQITTEAHEYFHAVQDTMIGPSVLGQGWWREPTAEFAAEEISNQNVSHLIHTGMGESVVRHGPHFDASHPYLLYIYFRFLKETRNFSVCDFMRAETSRLAMGDLRSALSAYLGAALAQSFLGFTEALLFFREPIRFGDDAPGIGSWLPPFSGFGFSATCARSVRGGSGCTIGRVEVDPQHISVTLSGSMLSATAPIGVIRDSSMNELARFVGNNDSTFLLKDVSVPEFHVSFASDLQSSDLKELQIVFDEFKLEISNWLVAETNEDGSSTTFDVALTASPGDQDFTFSVLSSDESEAKVDIDMLMFTKDNWNVPQRVTVTGQPDGVADGDQSFQINLASIAPTGWGIGDSLYFTNRSGGLLFKANENYPYLRTFKYTLHFEHGFDATSAIVANHSQYTIAVNDVMFETAIYTPSNQKLRWNQFPNAGDDLTIWLDDSTAYLDLEVDMTAPAPLTNFKIFENGVLVDDISITTTRDVDLISPAPTSVTFAMCKFLCGVATDVTSQSVFTVVP